MPSSAYLCVHAHVPQVQWVGRRWAKRSYTITGRDVCVLSWPRTEAVVRSLTDPANDVLHVRLPCHEPCHKAVQLQECHEDHLHLPQTGVGPRQLDHVWFTGLGAVFQSRMPSPLTHRLLDPLRHKKASKRTGQSIAGNTCVLGGYRDDEPDPTCPGPSMPFVPLAAVMFRLGDVFDGHRQLDDPALAPLLTPHAGGGLSPPPR